MSLERLLEELVECWEESRKAGREIPPEELCREHPEILDDVRGWIEALKATEWMERLAPEDSPSPGDRTRPIPERLGLPLILGRRYRLEALLGEGGFGRVWKGYDLVLRRSVAVKVARKDRAGRPAHLLEEARRAASLHHPGIVPVYDVGTEGEDHFIVTAWVNGETLADRAARNRINTREVARIIAEVAGALHFAHERGIVHRDVKPTNILIDEAGRAYVADFGLAATVREMKDGPAGLGTLGYASPEQMAGNRVVDRRTDVYSLGVILLELLTGKKPDTPFPATGERTSADMGLEREREGHLKGLLDIARRCLQKDPDGRYSTAKELAEDLRRPGRAKWSRRQDRWALVAFLLVIVTLVFLVPARRTPDVAPHRITRARGTENRLDRVPPAPGSVGWGWTTGPGGLVSSDAKGSRAIFVLSHDELPEAYELSLTVIQESRRGDSFGIGLVTGKTRVLVALNAHSGRLAGLERVDGRFLDRNPTRTDRGLFTRNVPHRVVCRVFRKDLVVKVDRTAVVRWPDFGRLSDPLAVVERVPRGRLYIAAWETRYRVLDIRIRPIVRKAPRTAGG